MACRSSLRSATAFALFLCATVHVSPSVGAEDTRVADETSVLAGTNPSIAVFHASAAEGDGRRREMLFRVKLSRPPCGPVRVHYRTEDGTATAADGDYIPASGVVDVRPGTPTLALTFKLFGRTPMNPTRMVVDRQQNIYLTDHYQATVTKYDGNGLWQWTVGGRGTGVGKFSTPIGIVMADNGTLRISDTGNNRLVSLTTDGQWMNELSIPFNGSNDSAIDANGNLYIYAPTAVRKFDSNGRLVASWPGSYEWRGFGADRMGHLYLGFGRSFVKYDTVGTVLGTFGNRGLPPDGLEQVETLIADPCGNVYVSQGSGVISMYDPDGNYVMRWGESGSGPGQMDRPVVMATDHLGNVYVWDHFNERVHKFRPATATAEIPVEIRSDTHREGDERFSIRVTAVENATLIGGVAMGTIVDDDSSTAAGPNLAGNPSFEESVTGWKAYGGAAIERFTGDAHHGTASLRISALAARGYSGINDSPNWIAATGSAPHRFTAWVRSVGFRGIVRLRIREYLAADLLGTHWTAPVSADDAWQMLALDVVPSRAGSTFDFNIVHDTFAGPVPGDAGEGFLVDDISISVPGRRDEAPVVSAPAEIVGLVGFPVEIPVRATDPDGEPLAELVADLSRLPRLGTDSALNVDLAAGAARFTWTPKEQDVALTPYRITFTASNALSDYARTAITVVPVSRNFIWNPTFPGTSVWWKPYLGATFEVSTEGRTDAGALRVSGSTLEEFGANDDGTQVKNLPAGAPLVLRGWVRSAEHRGSVRMRLREYSPEGMLLGTVTYSDPVTLSPEWRSLLLRYVTRGALSKFDLQFVDQPVAAGEWFLLDDVEVRQVFPPPGIDAKESVLDAHATALTAPGGEFVELAPRMIPNPARGAAMLEFTLPVAGRLRAELFDATGRRVRTLADEGHAPAGRHRLEVGGSRRPMAPGIYFYRVEWGAGVRRGRFVVLE